MIDQRQIRFRHADNRVDTLSLKRFGLSVNDFNRLQSHVDAILHAKRYEAQLPPNTMKFLRRIPRKLNDYLCRKLALQVEAEEASTIVDQLDLFEAHRQEQDTREATDRALMADLALLPVGRVCTSIEPEELAELLEQVADDHDYAPNTVARIAKHWNVFFNWLVESRVIGLNPARGLNMLIEPRPKAHVKTEWLDAMVAASTHCEADLWLRILQWTGCRLGESFLLRPCDFDLKRRCISITDSKCDRVRINPLYPAIHELLPTLHDRDPYQPLLQMVNASNCRRILSVMQDVAGVPAWRPAFTSIRATRANQLAADPNITPRQAGLLLGHSETVAARNYLSVDDALIRRMLEA